MDEAVACTQCHASLPPTHFNTAELFACPACGAILKADVFPAFFRGVAPGKDGETLKDNQAGCYYHPQKKAVIPCDHCGRFLCNLCNVELGGKHLCPACLETGKKKGSIQNLDRDRILYDSAALRLALYPLIPIINLLTIWFTPITAPIALYIALKHWNTPSSITGRSRVRSVLAIVFSSLQILAWITLIVYIAS